jgi:rubrerythrin
LSVRADEEEHEEEFSAYLEQHLKEGVKK